MTIDEQVDYLTRCLAHMRGKAGKSYEREVETFQVELRLKLKEVARDQRHACAEAVLQVDRFAQKAHQAVMNAEIK